MGTVKAFSGSGSKPANDLRDELTEWLDRLPKAPPDQPPPGEPPSDAERPRLSPDVLLHAVQLLRPRSAGGGGSDGPGGGGGQGRETTGTRSGGGANRSAVSSAASAGRAAAGAYAFLTGDTATLQRLGLDYDELAALGSPTEVARRIVEAACGPRSNSTVVDHEQRLIAADIAEWVLSEQDDGSLPTPEEIARETIAMIIAEAALVETGESSNQHDQGQLAEDEIRDAAHALADRADLSVTGATEAELAAAIESGIETLRDITGRSA